MTKLEIPGEAYAQDGLRVTNATTGPLVISGSADPSASPPSPGPPRGSLYLKTGGSVGLFQNTDGAASWSLIGGGGSVSDIPDWVPGTYSAGAIVKYEGYLWGATATTSLAPVVENGNLGSSLDWQPNGGSVTQSGNEATLAGNRNVISAALITGGWSSRSFQFNLLIPVIDECTTFGILDGAKAATTNPGIGMRYVAGFWGVEAMENYGGVLRGLTNGDIMTGNVGVMYASSGYMKWSMRITDDTSSVTMAVYRNDLLVARWSGLARPAFTSYRLAFGTYGPPARKCNSVQSLPVPAAWTCLGYRLNWG